MVTSVLLSVSVHLTSPDTSPKWKCTVFVLLGLGPFTRLNVSGVLPKAEEQTPHGCRDPTVLLHSHVNGHGCLYLFVALVNSVAMNMGVQVSV